MLLGVDLLGQLECNLLVLYTASIEEVNMSRKGITYNESFPHEFQQYLSACFSGEERTLRYWLREDVIVWRYSSILSNHTQAIG